MVYFVLQPLAGLIYIHNAVHRETQVQRVLHIQSQQSK